MKLKSTFTFAIAQALLLISVPSYGQTDGGSYRVTTDVTTKNILLEEFTGIHCGYCPQGHAIASTLRKASPKAYVVAIHAGYYSEPGNDEPDFRTSEGTEINDAFGVSGYPSGMVNRSKFNGSSTPVSGRSSWIACSKEVAEEEAPVNLLMESSYDGATGSLTVHVEGYFTADEQAAEQALCVAWTQDNIKGPQSGANMGDEYTHNNMLRDFITPVWGDELTEPAKGGYFSRDYTVTLPEAVNDVPVKPEDIRIVAFVIGDTDEVLNVTGGKPLYTNYDKPVGGTLSAPKIPVGTYYGYNFFELVLTNTSDKAITEATFDIDVNGTVHTSEWTGEIPSFDSAEITVDCDYAQAESGKNTYAITLRTINGESVEASSLQGDFASPVEATPTISVKLKTNNEAGDNTFTVRDADGLVVKEFGPYADGTSQTVDESITLEQDKTYCFEITDRWGDGIYSPRGELVLRSSDNTLIDQVYDIADFGSRSFFRTSKDSSSVNEIALDDPNREIEVWRTDGTLVHKGKADTADLPAGIYIIYDASSRTVTKKAVAQ